MAREFIDQPQNKWAFLRRTDQANTQLAIFVHGFYGNYLSTWGRIPDLLSRYADDPAGPDTRRNFADWDYLFLGYATGNVETYLDICGLITSQWRLARQGLAPFSRKYQSFALLGHSLGTLGIRQLLCATAEYPNGHINDLKGVALFGTPLNGSGLADMVFWNKIAGSLKPNNPQLRMLRSWSVGALQQPLPCPPVQVVLGLDDKVVGGAQLQQLAQWPGDAPIFSTNLDHSALVKPDDWHNAIVVDLIHNNLRQ